jgi:hypothetical protein
VLFVPERRRKRWLPCAIRARDVRAADLQEEPMKSTERDLTFRDRRFVGFDDDGGSPANIAASGSERSSTASAASGAIKLARRIDSPAG